MATNLRLGGKFYSFLCNKLLKRNFDRVYVFLHTAVCYFVQPNEADFIEDLK